MKRLMAVVLLLMWITPNFVADLPTEAVVSTAAIQTTSTPPTPCPMPGQLAEGSQTDCCKGHKGVCGCRAGKIVCCDNTTSVNCTCHADSGVDI